MRVVDLNNYIKRVTDSDPILSDVCVQGEISNISKSKTGHIYFSLKDEESVVRCAIWASVARNLRYELKDGMNVIVQGNVNLYVKGGYYSVNIYGLEIEGEGSLAAAFEAMKEKLKMQGLFDYQYKKRIPEFPSNLAIITSEHGAALKDILEIIKQRNNFVNIMIFPVIVQGDGAAADIARTIALVNEEFEYFDTILLSRGGGSMEDLWAFNEEILAHAIFSSKIPIISAVGHEVDVTISDMVADLRATTPTNGAALAVPDISEIMNHVYDMRERAKRAVSAIVDRDRQTLEYWKARLNGLNPRKIIERGYGALLDENRDFISSVEKLNVGDLFSIMMQDGEIEVEIKKIKKVSEA
ncbi:MAG: exodeoxyribonuclease VII large subunit [Gallibacter sp.]|nr:exodeoxyribonuclease VII large subunit [Gallibacter sp.]